MQTRLVQIFKLLISVTVFYIFTSFLNEDKHMQNFKTISEEWNDPYCDLFKGRVELSLV